MPSFDRLDSVILKREDDYFLGKRYMNKVSDLLIYLILRNINRLIPSKTVLRKDRTKSPWKNKALIPLMKLYFPFI